MTQEQSLLTKIMAVFAAEEIILQYNVLGYRVDAYLPKHKLETEVDEQGHNGRPIDPKIERQKATETELGCKFIRIDPSKEDYYVSTELRRIQNYTVKLTKKSTKSSLIDEILKRLLRLDFKSSNSIKTKCLKYSVKNVLPTI